jgi:hypothetical protein
MVSSLYDKRVEQYHEGIKKQLNLAHKVKVAKVSQKDNFFAIDPMGKIFIPHYSGNEYINEPRLFIAISIFLARFSNRVTQSINFVMENR